MRSLARTLERTLVWFRGKDLRVADHAPLLEAAQMGDVLPVFVLEPFFFAPDRVQKHAHRLQYLLDALAHLDASLAAVGSRLLLVQGPDVEAIPRLADEWRADRVVAHRRTEPGGRERDRQISGVLGEGFVLYEGETLLPPGTLGTAGGRPFRVFTQFANAFYKSASLDAPLPAPGHLPPLPPDLASAGLLLPSLESLGLRRNPGLLKGGETAATQRLQRFLADTAAGYATSRNRLDIDGTSRLSADLKFGTISVRRVWSAVAEASGSEEEARPFLNELLWREFNYNLLWERPELLREPFRPEFARFPWRQDEAGWRAWVEGRTGFPVVDAAARQLLAEGFVPNRARMIAASFLTKHLMIDYRRGEAHYLKYLVDGDWAQNNAGWQWSAGCGSDAQPYFRVFNPTLQGKRFDPDGDYVRRWLPELVRLPAAHVHEPWSAPPDILRAAGIELGRDYPRPIVDHGEARQRYLSLVKQHLAEARSG